MEDGARERLTIPIIGGGWAGCAAALTLADNGYRVALYEMAHTLGGRARRVVRDGLPLDNGQHILLGAYVEARRAIATTNGAAPTSITRQPLAIAPFATTQPGALAFRAWRLPSPLGHLMALLSARGLSWHDRMAATRWFADLRKQAYRVGATATVTEMIATAPRRARERLLMPLCVSALNTPPARASAQMFANVLRAAFDGANAASDMLLPSTDLATLFPDNVARMLAANGHAVFTRSEATIVGSGERAVRLRVDGREFEAPGVIIAVAPHQLARTFASEAGASASTRAALEQVARLEWEPIVTVYLGYSSPVDIPAALVQLDDAPGQWIFDRRDILARAQGGAPALAALLAVVISARGPHDALANEALCAAVDSQLRRLRPSMPPLVWSQAIAERRATYSCTPTAARPRAGRLAAGIYLAGDYTDQEFPATLEAAVRSGRVAAEALARDLSG